MRMLGAYALIAAMVAVVFAAGILGGGFRAVERSDYMTYHVAARIVLDGNGACLYDVACQEAEQRELIGEESSFERGALPFNSPPWLAAVLLPLGLLPLHLAFALFTVASLLVLAAAVWRAAPGAISQRLVTSLLVLTAWPTVMGAIRGQSTILVVALLAIAVVGSGIALGLSALKPTLGPLWAVWLLAMRRWRELAVATLLVAALVALAALVVSPQAVAAYPAHLLGVAAPDAVGVHVDEMINWRGAAERLGTGPWLYVAGTIATVVVVAFAWISSRSPAMAAAAAFIATPLVIPHANQHEAILAEMGVVLAIGAAGSVRNRVAAGAVASHAVLWAGPVLPAQASAWLLFAALLVWLGGLAWLAVREPG
jgi:hypothetical protein